MSATDTARGLFPFCIPHRIMMTGSTCRLQYVRGFGSKPKLQIEQPPRELEIGWTLWPKLIRNSDRLGRVNLTFRGFPMPGLPLLPNRPYLIEQMVIETLSNSSRSPRGCCFYHETSNEVRHLAYTEGYGLQSWFIVHSSLRQFPRVWLPWHESLMCRHAGSNTKSCGRNRVAESSIRP